jgi:drug/metabolite transporter (DMT)-like permease
MNPARLRAYLMLLAVAIIWGVASPVIKYTLQGFPPDLFLTYRFGISTIVAIIIFTVGGIHFPKEWNTILLIIAYGFLNSVVSLGFLFFGMENTSVLEAGLITLASPLLISTAGVYFLHEHITKREKIGMGVAIIGTALTIIGPLLTNGHSEIKFSGNLMIFGYVISTLITTLLVKKLLKRNVTPIILTNFSFIIGFVCFGSYMLLTNPSELYTISTISSQYHLGVIYMAIISGNLAFYLSNKAQKSIEIGEQSLFSYLYPLFSLPLAVLWLGEKVTPIYILGGIIIIIGVAIAEIKKKRYNTK